MKLFAKRKRKSDVVDVDGATNESSNNNNKQRVSFASDPVVEELMKMNPSDWNSEQKRMIKRYNERKQGASVQQEENSEKKTPAAKESASEDTKRTTQKEPTIIDGAHPDEGGKQAMPEGGKGDSVDEEISGDGSSNSDGDNDDDNGKSS